MSKKVTVLNKLSELLAKLDIKFGLLTGGSSLEMQQDIKNKFATSQIQLLLMQSDVGKEAHTLPAAKATIFIDRDFAQGYNEQAEARMTPVDGSDATKYVIDLVMKDSVEEHIYSTLVIRKKSIKSINDLNP
jgi:SNF2 family DNA or RNA helicase